MPATSGYRARAVLMFRSVGFLQVSQNQVLGWVGMATRTLLGRVRRRLALRAGSAPYERELGSNLDLHAQAIHKKEPWDTRTKDCA